MNTTGHRCGEFLMENAAAPHQARGARLMLGAGRRLSGDKRAAAPTRTATQPL